MPQQDQPDFTSTFPKLKYQGQDEAPGFRWVRVADPDEEEALEGDWFDVPGEALKAAREKRNAGEKPQDDPTASPRLDDRKRTDSTSNSPTGQAGASYSGERFADPQPGRPQPEGEDPAAKNILAQAGTHDPTPASKKGK